MPCTYCSYFAVLAALCSDGLLLVRIAICPGRIGDEGESHLTDCRRSRRRAAESGCWQRSPIGAAQQRRGNVTDRTPMPMAAVLVERRVWLELPC